MSASRRFQVHLLSQCSRSHDENVEQRIGEAKEKLSANLLKQERLSGIFAEGLLAMEAYKNQILPLREEEQALRAEVSKLELQFIEREHSEQYRKLLQAVLHHVESLQKEPDLATKKGFLKLVFRTIIVDNGAIKDFRLFKPFDVLYRRERICKEPDTQQEVATCQQNVSTWLPSAAK